MDQITVFFYIKQRATLTNKNIVVAVANGNNGKIISNFIKESEN
jgi:hypothetical protein